VLLPPIQTHLEGVLATKIDAVPDLVVSCVDVAVTTAVPVPAGVNTPEDVIVPSVAAQLTAELYDPVPFTVAAQAEVWVVRMEAGEQVTETEVIVDCVDTATDALPDFVESSVEVAEIVAVPAAAGVNTPELLIEPMLMGLTDHVTEELTLPVPLTVAVQFVLCPV